MVDVKIFLPQCSGMVVQCRSSRGHNEANFFVDSYLSLYFFNVIDYVNSQDDFQLEVCKFDSLVPLSLHSRKDKIRAIIGFGK